MFGDHDNNLFHFEDDDDFFKKWPSHIEVHTERSDMRNLWSVVLYCALGLAAALAALACCCRRRRQRGLVLSPPSVPPVPPAPNTVPAPYPQQQYAHYPVAGPGYPTVTPGYPGLGYAMPQPAQLAQHAAPYPAAPAHPHPQPHHPAPTAPALDHHGLPPSYDQAVLGEKSFPYNPNVPH